MGTQQQEQHPLDKFPLTLEGRHLACQLLAWMQTSLRPGQVVSVWEIQKSGLGPFQYVQPIRHALDVLQMAGFVRKSRDQRTFLLTLEDCA